MAEEKAKYTRLPFALCMDYGIHIEDWWTPKDAWDALKRKGVVESVAKEYKKHFESLKKGKSKISDEADTGIVDITFAKNRRLPQSALTKQEWAKWYSCIADIKSGYYMPKNRKGFLIQIDKKIIQTSGSFLKPKALACYTFKNKENAADMLSEWKEN